MLRSSEFSMKKVVKPRGQELVLPQYSSSLSSVQSSFPSQSTSLGTQSPLSHSYWAPLQPVYARKYEALGKQKKVRYKHVNKIKLENLG